MATKPKQFSRRTLLKGAVFSAVAINVVHTRSLAASEALSEDDPTAKALGYHADATSVSKEDYPEFSAEQTCANCLQYQGKADDEIGGCALFAGKTVEAAGWCKVWAKK